MRVLELLLPSLLSLLACQNPETNGNASDLAKTCPNPPDLAPPIAPCAAAKGLSGDVLGNLCIDFSTIPDQTLTIPPPQQLAGWTFGKDLMGNDCWKIMGGILQQKDFANFASTCNFVLPAVSSDDFNKYDSFTLSVVQTLNIDATQQKVQIMLGLADPSTRLVDWATGTQPRQRRIYEIAKAALPNGNSDTYQPLFQLISGNKSSLLGWQIESIAVLGNL